MKHKASEGEEVETGKRLAQTFVVAGQSAKSRGPSETALDRPATRQEHEATLCFGMFHDLQLNPMLSGGLLRIVSGIALINISQLHAIARELLHRLRQLLNLISVLFVRRGHVQGQKL